MAEPKYWRLGRKSDFAFMKCPTDEQMNNLERLIDCRGLKVKIGG